MIEATSLDDCLQLAVEAIRSGDWPLLQHPVVFCTPEDSSTLQAFYHARQELSASEDDCLLRGPCLILPASLWSRAIALAHQGIVKSKSRFWSKVWFPGHDQQVEKVIMSCVVCLASGQTDPPAITEEGPTVPWQRASADFWSPPDGSYILIVMDDYSRYPEVEIITKTEVIPKTEKIMATHGLFGELLADNAPLFNSHEWAKFLQTQNVKHRRITPWWPQANGEVERFVRTLSKTV
ncbi:hypothetical protein NDU88_005750 [Pleurodeles waltl]|uniref:Gypsy retrotransposon integrase-like protein 1 n=1 Tax=Pleurodeles waltl TaxID=8319 RepID=A0AAV7LM36_PLEWA|nr:hypothetical protein NDU88_005750 [Pleurodeles waltl]